MSALGGQGRLDPEKGEDGEIEQHGLPTALAEGTGQIGVQAPYPSEHQRSGDQGDNHVGERDTDRPDPPVAPADAAFEAEQQVFQRHGGILN